MRTINSIRNMLSGILGQLLTIIMQFASRTIFINTLGVTYLGISGLFTNILNVLNITELGIGTAIVFSLYKPLSGNDHKKIAQTMNFLRKAYLIIGGIVAIVGLAISPFLSYMITDVDSVSNIKTIYYLYLLQSVSSYWFLSYKASILKADQKKYIDNKIRYFVTNLFVVVQILSLLFFKSFILYLIIGILSHISVNLFISKKVDKIYPYLSEYRKETLPEKEKKRIMRDVIGMSMYKINSVIVRSTDNIVISTFISTVTVGFYSNYQLIISTIITFTRLFFSSLSASVGNLFVSDKKEKSLFIFNCIALLSFWIYGFASVSLWSLLNPFITLWIGEEFLFSQIVVMVIVIDFIMDGYQQISIMYKDACGLFWRGKFRPIATALVNIVISVLLAPRIGLLGVILGTIISRLLTTWWFEPRMIHKYAFEQSSKRYYFLYFSFLILTFGAGWIVTILGSLKYFSLIIEIMFKLILSILVPNIIYFITYRNTAEFKYMMKSLKKILNKGKK